MAEFQLPPKISTDDYSTNTEAKEVVLSSLGIVLSPKLWYDIEKIKFRTENNKNFEIFIFCTTLD